MTKFKDAIVLSGKAQWAKVHAPDSMSDKYQIDVFLDPDSLKLADKVGLTLKEKDGTFVTAKSKKAPVVVDKDRHTIPPSQMVGNGSQVSIKVTPFEYDFKGQRGITAILQAVKVLTLVDYAAGAEDEFTPRTAADPFADVGKLEDDLGSFVEDDDIPL